ncbi:MAG: F0F1 ATP synthase subunit gamma [Candidatus Omnitrophica bacterium]|nr:F0F1 ATP synthase subunit gamma [Candidatus Omnitrophota bacterium]MDD5488852.1 F0F1 ATP synthase subunit gamma [Candidatus Omnitrophota bacterium]
MSKTAKLKSDLEDMESLVEIFQILKDVASNHFYNTAKRKQRFVEFAESFVGFFRMVSLAEATSPLVHPSSENVGLLAITSEGGFMAEMTAKILNATMAEAKKHRKHDFMVIGYKGAEKMQLRTEKELTIFRDVEEKGLFKIALEVKKHIISEVEKGNMGRVFAVYPKAITANFIKPVTIKLLPSEELVTKQTSVKDAIEKVIVESEQDDIIHYLADVWLACRLYEMLEDCIIAGFAAQAMQLESSLDSLKKDQKGLVTAFRKSKKGDIDKSLREVFTAKTIMSGGKR